MELPELDLASLLDGASPLASLPEAIPIPTDDAFWDQLMAITTSEVPQAEDDDEEEEEAGYFESVTPATSTAASAALNGATVCNNKTLQDAHWPRELLDMSTVQLNRHLRKHPMSAALVTELKAARRRMKNRGYSKSLRERRKETRKQVEVDPAESMAADKELEARIAFLEAQNIQMRQENDYMERQLQESFETISRLEDLLARNGVPLPPLAAAAPVEASQPAQ